MDWKEIVLRLDGPLMEGLFGIDATGSQMALVVDSARIFLGTLNARDIRRALARGAHLLASDGKVLHHDSLRQPEGRNHCTEGITGWW
jgi:hypothetical protein